MNSTYLDRLETEYKELSDKIVRLDNMLDSYSRDTLTFIPHSTIELLTMQLTHMLAYQKILKIRLNIEAMEI